MEVTKFVASGREKSKLFGNWASYRKHLSNRIHNLRKKLGIATKAHAKYASRAPVTAEDISRSPEFVHLLLLTSERAWANAMSMKEIHAAEKKGITSSTRSHIISRLYKATIYAKNLYAALADQDKSGASIEDILEARAYAASLMGAMEFEKHNWEACVKSYSETRIIYVALGTATNSDIFKDLLLDPVDPSIRYGAYQMRLPRTVAISTIAQKFFPRSDIELVAQVETLDADSLNGIRTKSKSEAAEPGIVPKTITWRSRTVDLEEAMIATALASVNTATKNLSDTLASATIMQARDRASAYDDVLIASQDVVDATKHAIDELINEGVGQGDTRMQSLQITRTAVSYEMVSWRIGRNRVLAGDRDGALEDSSIARSSKKKKCKPVKEEGTGRKLARCQEKDVLYDGILQSFYSIKELPGIAADAEFLEEWDAQYGYFSALKCLNIARSHALLSNSKSTLALLARASEKCDSAHSYFSSAKEISKSSPPNISVSPAQVQYLKNLLHGEVQRYRAMVELSKLNETVQNSEEMGCGTPLIERLHEYPTDVNLENIVCYPPKLEPVPVKPLFFDAAWNYINYPNRLIEKGSSNNEASTATGSSEQGGQQKKGWFGFGR